MATHMVAISQSGVIPVLTSRLLPLLFMSFQIPDQTRTTLANPNISQGNSNFGPTGDESEGLRPYQKALAPMSSLPPTP